MEIEVVLRDIGEGGGSEAQAVGAVEGEGVAADLNGGVGAVLLGELLQGLVQNGGGGRGVAGLGGFLFVVIDAEGADRAAGVVLRVGELAIKPCDGGFAVGAGDADEDFWRSGKFLGGPFGEDFVGGGVKRGVWYFDVCDDFAGAVLFGLFDKADGYGFTFWVVIDVVDEDAALFYLAGVIGDVGGFWDVHGLC